MEKKTVSREAAKKIFAEMYATGDAAAEIAERRGLWMSSLEGHCRLAGEAVASNWGTAQAANEKPALVGSLVGEAMKLSGGRADAKLLGMFVRLTLLARIGTEHLKPALLEEVSTWMKKLDEEAPP